MGFSCWLTSRFVYASDNLHVFEYHYCYVGHVTEEQVLPRRQSRTRREGLGRSLASNKPQWYSSRIAFIVCAGSYAERQLLERGTGGQLPFWTSLRLRFQ